MIYITLGIKNQFIGRRFKQCYCGKCLKENSKLDKKKQTKKKQARKLDQNMSWGRPPYS